MHILTITSDDAYQAALVRRAEITDELEWRYAEASFYDQGSCSKITALENENVSLTRDCIAYETHVLNLKHIW